MQNKKFFQRKQQTANSRSEEQKARDKPGKLSRSLVFLLALCLFSLVLSNPAQATEAEQTQTGLSQTAEWTQSTQVSPEQAEPGDLEETGLRASERVRRYAIPGGQSIGVLLSTEGVTVVGFSPVLMEDGSLRNPAEEAGLVSGDFITKINGENVLSNADISRIITEAGEAGQPCIIQYVRNGGQRKLELEPIFCRDTKSWRIGLYVRDNLCGVGTLSFYDPENHQFAALGHEVADIQHDAAGSGIGSVIRASVQSIRAGTSGVPGEKLGAFLKEDWAGEIRINGSFGVYGRLNAPPEMHYTESILPIAFPEEVQSGPAQIYTVLEGEKIECFSVNIVKTMESHKSSGHGMILEITDEHLIDKCGGIVQGMSGSPIIQNGLLVGAVTHVFVNDPLHGYGCFALWMLEEAEEEGA